MRNSVFKIEISSFHIPEPKVQFSKQLMVFWVPAGLLFLAKRLPRLLCLLRVFRQENFWHNLKNMILHFYS